MLRLVITFLKYIQAMSMCSLSAPDFPSMCCAACVSGCGILSYNNVIMIKDNLGLLVERMVCHEYRSGGIGV